MKFKKALEKLNRIAEHMGSRLDTADLMIMIHSPGSIGGTPSIPVLDINAGFDWDANKVLITTDKALSLLTIEERDAISVSISKGQSWHAYQAHKKLTDKITALENELSQYRENSASK